MKRNNTIAALALGLFVAFAMPSYAETPQEDLVKNFYATLEGTMKEGPTLGFEGRYNKLKPVIEKTFDLPLMARYAVGSKWRKIPEEAQKKIVNAFSAFSIATYASRFTKYDGESFVVSGEKEAAGGAIMVETKLIPDGEAPVALNYLVRNNSEGKPRIADVYLDASISELATRRSEFSAVIERDGVEALIASLEQKVAKMRETK